MKILELFSGTESFSKVARARGHQTFTIEMDKSFNPNLCMDILDFDISMLPEEFKNPDIIWASPPCTTFSVASIRHYWENGKPKNEKTLHGIAIVKKTLEIINQLNPKFYVVENPRGMLRKQEFMQELHRDTVTYCQYGAKVQKPTDLWNNLNHEFRSMCKPGSPCHEPASRGARNGVQGINNSFSNLGSRGKVKRAIVPEKLCSEIIQHCEQLIATPSDSASQVVKMETDKIFQQDCVEGLKKLPNESIDLIFADPWYYSENQKTKNAFENDVFWEITEKWLRELLRVIKKTGHIFISFSSQKMAKFEFLLAKLSAPLKSRIVWHYRNAGGRCADKGQFGKTYEMIYHFGFGSELNFPEKWGEERFDVWTISIPQSNYKDKKFHPFQKPLALLERIVEIGSREGEIVLDPFMGSGTTAVASKMLNRRFIGFEIDPQWIEVAEKRLESATPRTLPTAIPTGEFNKDLTATQQVASPKSASQTSLNPDIKRNKFEGVTPQH